MSNEHTFGLALVTLVSICLLHKINDGEWPELFPNFVVWAGIVAAFATGVSRMIDGSIFQGPWFYNLVLVLCTMLVSALAIAGLWECYINIKRLIEKDKS